ncbi:MAG: NAD(P)-dependent oxidoreductase, partial [Oligoflexales bacterium]|nr:NAD(P)-dependent oxidoreductase [Oligoflexales bacterium]
MKKVLITGVSSFVGCHLAKKFSRYYQVIGTCTREPWDYEGLRRLRLDSIKSDVEIICMNILDKDSVEKALRGCRPDHWIHHAGYAKNYSSLDYNLEESLQTNLFCLKECYNLFKKYDVEKVIVTGSSMEYGNSDLALCESIACVPNTPYGLSKLTTSLRSIALARELNIPTAVLRIFIPFGCFDEPKRLIPAVFDSLRNGRAVDLTPCTQKRDFIFIDDLVMIYRSVLEGLSETSTGIYNACSGSPVSLRDFLECLAEKMKCDKNLL